MGPNRDDDSEAPARSIRAVLAVPVEMAVARWIDELPLTEDKQRIGNLSWGLTGQWQKTRSNGRRKPVGRAFKPGGTVVKLGLPDRHVETGGRNVVMMAGLCTVESAEQASTIAGIMKRLRNSHPARRRV